MEYWGGTLENMEMSTLFSEIYKNKNVIITGHSGFKGSWLSLWLSKLGANVTGISLAPPTNPGHIELLNLDIKSIISDIRNKDRMVEIFKKTKPDIIFHLAAQPLVRYSYENPSETYETNVIGTLNIFEAARLSNSAQAIVCITTDKCYENKEWNWGYRETDRLGGHDPYSSSKACAEILAASYRNSYFNLNNYNKNHNTLLATARAGNVVGGGDWANDRIIPDIIRSISNGQTLIIRNPNSTRPWQHVLEPLRGYLMLGEQLLKGRTQYAKSWNFGPEDLSAISVKEIVNIVQKKWPAFSYQFEDGATNLHEAKLLKLDISQAKNELKWYPVWNAEATFERVINWYKTYYTSEQILSEQDLKNYLDDVREHDNESSP